MRVVFVERDSAPERLVCEAEVVFEAEAGPLAGMKLVGFSLWRSPEGEVYVTFPSRAFGAGNERRFFDFLRSVEGTAADSKRVKAWILEQYRSSREARRTRGAPVALGRPRDLEGPVEGRPGGPRGKRVTHPSAPRSSRVREGSREPRRGRKEGLRVRLVEEQPGDEATRNAYGFSQLSLFLGGASHPPNPPGRLPSRSVF